MTDKHVPGKSVHLKMALTFLAFWVLIFYVLFQNLRVLGGIDGLIDEVKSGGYSDLILLAFSVFLLAKGVHHLHLYFSMKNEK